MRITKCRHMESEKWSMRRLPIQVHACSLVASSGLHCWLKMLSIRWSFLKRHAVLSLQYGSYTFCCKNCAAAFKLSKRGTTFACPNPKFFCVICSLLCSAAQWKWSFHLIEPSGNMSMAMNNYIHHFFSCKFNLRLRSTPALPQKLWFKN
jgi:hypothetical protein